MFLCSLCIMHHIALHPFSFPVRLCSGEEEKHGNIMHGVIVVYYAVNNHVVVTRAAAQSNERNNRPKASATPDALSETLMQSLLMFELEKLRSINWGAIGAYEMYASFSPSLVPPTTLISFNKLHLYFTHYYINILCDHGGRK